MKTVATFVLGLIFGAGLIVSGMTSPDKVLGFLDIAGAWDPSLAFVMGGAIAVALPMFRIARRKEKPALADSFDRPDKVHIDAKLVIGAVLFGVGWGLAGICPGPALVNLAIKPVSTAVFVVAMLAGLLIAGRAHRLR